MKWVLSKTGRHPSHCGHCVLGHMTINPPILGYLIFKPWLLGMEPWMMMAIFWSLRAKCQIVHSNQTPFPSLWWICSRILGQLILWYWLGNGKSSIQIYSDIFRCIKMISILPLKIEIFCHVKWSDHPVDGAYRGSLLGFDTTRMLRITGAPWAA